MNLIGKLFKGLDHVAAPRRPFVSSWLPHPSGSNNEGIVTMVHIHLRLARQYRSPASSKPTSIRGFYLAHLDHCSRVHLNILEDLFQFLPIFAALSDVWASVRVFTRAQHERQFRRLEISNILCRPSPISGIIFSLALDKTENTSIAKIEGAVGRDKVQTFRRLFLDSELGMREDFRPQVYGPAPLSRYPV